LFQGKVQDPVRDDKIQEENPVVMTPESVMPNLFRHLSRAGVFQHLIKAFLPLADTSFISIYRTGFSDAFLTKMICVK